MKFKKSLSVLLVLAMIAPVLAMGITLPAIAATEGGDTLDTVETWQYKNYYQSDFSTGSISGTQLLKADGTKDMVSWNGFNGADVSLSGEELIFADASFWSYQTKITPGNMENNSVGIGPTMIGFDTYFGAINGAAGSVPGTFIFTLGGQTIFRINRSYGLVYYGSSSWSDYAGRDNRPLGWYTFEMIFVPQDADGNICLTEDQTVAKNTLYFRVKASSDTVEEAPETLSHADLGTWYKADLPGSACDHFVNIQDSMRFGYSNSSDTDTGTFSMRRSKAANLRPYAPPAVEFEGYSDLTQKGEAGTQMTLPTVNGVLAWELDGKCYEPGSTYTIAGDVTFRPLISEIWNMTSGYDSAALWGSSDSIVDRGYAIFHYNDDSAGWGWTPVISWSQGSDYGSYSYDKTQQAITIDSYGAYKNCAQWYLARPQAKLAGTTHFAMSYQVWYTAGDFDGMNLFMDTTTALTATTAGKVTMANGTELGNLQEGWNTVRIYILPNYDTDGTTVKNFNFHVSLNSSVNDGDAMSNAAITALPYEVWSVKSITSDSLLRIRMIDSAATSTAPTTIKLRGFTTYSMSAATLNFVEFGGKADVASVPNGTDIVLPSAAGVHAWTDGTNIYEVGSTYTPTSTLDKLEPVSLKMSGATVDITHGGAMRLIVRVRDIGWAPAGTLVLKQEGQDASYQGTLKDGYYIYETGSVRPLDLAQKVGYSLVADDVTYDSRSISVLEVLAGIYKFSSPEEQTLIAAMVNYAYYSGATTAVDEFNAIAGANTIGVSNLDGVSLEMKGVHNIADGYTIALSLTDGFIITASNGETAVNQKVLFTDMDKEVWIGENAVGGKTTVNNMLYIYMTGESFSEDIHNQAKALVLYQQALSALTNAN